ncbi:MAG: hypothetical protein MUF50_03535 [Planctomycetes bacterium]|jgi:hypothetical protein|nr:hypothetical protein [Planctomycetota bacterium]
MKNSSPFQNVVTVFDKFNFNSFCSTGKGRNNVQCRKFAGFRQRQGLKNFRQQIAYQKMQATMC